MTEARLKVSSVTLVRILWHLRIMVLIHIRKVCFQRLRQDWRSVILVGILWHLLSMMFILFHFFPLCLPCAISSMFCSVFLYCTNASLPMLHNILFNKTFVFSHIINTIIEGRNQWSTIQIFEKRLWRQKLMGIRLLMGFFFWGGSYFIFFLHIKSPYLHYHLMFFSNIKYFHKVQLDCIPFIYIQLQV